MVITYHVMSLFNLQIREATTAPPAPEKPEAPQMVSTVEAYLQRCVCRLPYMKMTSGQASGSFLKDIEKHCGAALPWCPC